MERVNEKRDERILRMKVRDTILRENTITGGNLNDYANLSVRLSATDVDALQDFFDENLEDGVKYKVVISTDDDINADFTYECEESGFNAHFYKQ